jgi:hypothetical protein
MNILIIRYNSNGELMSSKPCRDCIELLRTIGIQRIYYSTDQHQIVFERLDTISSKHISWGYRYLLEKNQITISVE